MGPGTQTGWVFGGLGQDRGPWPDDPASDEAVTMLPRTPDQPVRSQSGQSTLEYAATLGVAAVLIVMVAVVAYFGYLS